MSALCVCEQSNLMIPAVTQTVLRNFVRLSNLLSDVSSRRSKTANQSRLPQQLLKTRYLLLFQCPVVTSLGLEWYWHWVIGYWAILADIA